MVSRLHASSLAAFFVLSISFLSCGGGADEFAGHVVGGSQPLLITVDPSEAPAGATVTLQGTGFSIVPAENIVSAGGASTVAETFEVVDDGNEVITFEVPVSASPGESPLFIIVDGHTSNALTFTVIP